MFVQVRRRFVSSRNRNNIVIENALQDILNGGDTMMFLRRVASVNESYINNTLGHDVHNVDVDYPPIGINILYRFF